MEERLGSWELKELLDHKINWNSISQNYSIKLNSFYVVLFYFCYLLSVAWIGASICGASFILMENCIFLSVNYAIRISLESIEKLKFFFFSSISPILLSSLKVDKIDKDRTVFLLSQKKWSGVRFLREIVIVDLFVSDFMLLPLLQKSHAGILAWIWNFCDDCPVSQ